MATAYGGWVGGDDWRAKVDAAVTSNTATTAVITVKCIVESEYGTTSGYSNIQGGTLCNGSSYSWGSATSISTNSTKTLKTSTYTITKTHASQSINAKAQVKGIAGIYSGSTSTGSVNVTVGAKTSYQVNYYGNNATGGSTAAQTKWYGESLALRSNGFTRTGFTFQGWATSASGSVAYAAGATYTGNATLNLYAVWKAITYSVAYNANGGSGAPASQVKTYGTTLTLSSTVPSRVGYDFVGWATSSTATTATYQPGGSYTANAAITLYAIWKLAYASPTISGLVVIRSDGTQDDDEGTYMRVAFSWAVDTTDSGTVSGIEVKHKAKGTSTWSSEAVPASGASGSVSVILSATFAAATAYDVQVAVTDSHGLTSTKTTILSPTLYTLDFLAGGTGMAIGKACASSGLHVAWDADFDGDIYLPNGKSIYGTDTNGNAVKALETCNGSNNLTLGYGGYAASQGATNIYGNNVNLSSKGNVNINGGGLLWGGSKQYKEVLDSTGKSLASGTWTSLGSVSLTAGVWVVVFTAQFTSNATGRRGINLATTAGSSSTNAQAAMLVPAASGAQTVVSRAIILNVTSTNTYHINAYQNSGSALTTYSDIRVIRVA